MKVRWLSGVIRPYFDLTWTSFWAPPVQQVLVQGVSGGVIKPSQKNIMKLSSEVDHGIK